MIGSFQLNILIRIILLVLVSTGTGFAVAAGEPLYTIITIVIVLIIQIINLAFYINRVNVNINYFFEAVKNEDFSLTFPVYKGDKILKNISKNLTRINRQIQQIHVETQQQEQYFRALIEQVGTGILSFNHEGFVIHTNSSLKKIFGMRQFTHLRQLEKIDLKLAETLKNIKQHDQKLITYNGKNGAISLLLKASSFKAHDQELTLISLQDINRELDEKELDSWLKLIRVLTHEIMNSIAPVTSLSENLCNYFVREGEAIPVGEVNDKMIATTIRGLKVIQEQGQGLTRFVESYRKLTRLPKPERTIVSLKDLMEKTVMLHKSDLPYRDINISYSMDDPELEAFIDQKQISQVLINLLKNSVEALHCTRNAYIKLVCRKTLKGQIEISVTDNGPGIPPELLEEIFVPFFTTREAGSGIGLSISRQIMRLHNGSLKVNSIPGKETIFTLIFN
jgi:two-component system, NtrC family, nitrogen regulation sensor histidine kinase NtrY